MKDGSFPLQSGPMLGGLVSPGRAYYPASLSKGTECSASCIICPASRKWGSSRCVLHLLGIEYHLASLEAGSESPFTLPGTAGGYRFDKTNKTKKGRPVSRSPLCVLQCFLFQSRRKFRLHIFILQYQFAALQRRNKHPACIIAAFGAAC